MKSLNQFISEEDIQNFSNVKDIQDIARKALTHTFMLSPIYMLSRINQSTNKIDDQIIQNINLFNQISEYTKSSSNIIVFHFDKPIYQYVFKNPNFKLITHTYTNYNLKTAGENIVSKIRNKCLDDFSRNHINEDWLFMFDDDILFQRIYDFENDLPVLKNCDTWQSLFITLVIWQYITDQCYINKNITIGMSGFPGYDSKCLTIKPDEIMDSCVFRINLVRLVQAVLLNYSFMKTRNIRYETEFDVWDDLDMNMQIAYNKGNILAVDYPICLTTSRPLVSDKSNIVYSVDKLNNFAVQMYYKWGNLIKYRGWFNDSGIYAINAKLPNDFGDIINNAVKITHDPVLLEDSKKLMSHKITLADFVEKHI